MRNNKPFLYQQLKWMAIYVAIALGISFVVPFPFSFLAIIGAVLLLSLYVRKNQLGKMGLSRSSMFGGRGGYNKYYCANCGVQHNQIACPRCGSKVKKVGS